MSSTVLVPILALVLLYLWLRGWWFAGLIVCLGWGLFSVGTLHAWFVAAAIGFAPWLFWLLVRDHHRLQTEKQQALRTGQCALRLPQ